jgi:hypothetical protein
MTYEFSLETTTTGKNIWGVNDGPNGGNWEIQFNADEAFNDDAGNFRLFLRDDNGDDLSVAPSTNPGLNDGDTHKVTIDVVDSATNTVDIYLDGSEVSVSYANQQSPDNFAFSRDFGFFARNNDGTVDSYIDIAHGIHRFHGSSTGGQTI